MGRAHGKRTWRIPNRMGPATALAREAMEWLDPAPVSEQAKYFIRLTLEELLSNTIKYGYDDSAEHFITVRILLDPDFIRLELTDDGHVFNPTLQPSPDVEQNLNSDKEGGFGIELVRRLCRDMNYRRQADHNLTTVHIGTLDPDEPLAPDPPPKEPHP